MKKWLLLGLGVLASGALGAQQAPRFLDLAIGMYRIRAEVAATEHERQVGLMNRSHLPAQAGMLFVFEKSAQHCFWMKNTLLPLSIAFLDSTGKIVDLADMKPQSEESHCPNRPIRYALEMNQGWFRSHGATVGAVVNGIPSLRKP